MLYALFLFFLRLNNIPLYVHTTFSLSIHTLEDFKQGCDLGCDLEQSLWGCSMVLEQSGGHKVAAGRPGCSCPGKMTVAWPQVWQRAWIPDVLEVESVGFVKGDKIFVLTLEMQRWLRSLCLELMLYFFNYYFFTFTKIILI